MPTPAIVPTITQRVRFFLAEQGAALRPWTGLEATFDELYALLRLRRSDPEFWRPLKTLLQEVVDDAAESQRRGRRTSGAAELLDSWQVDALVDELRDALPEDTVAGVPVRTDFTRTLSTAVLGGFLLLGLAAVGCGNGNGNDELGAGGSIGSGGSGGQSTVLTGSGGTSSGVGGTIALGSGGSGSGGMLGSGGSGSGGMLGSGGSGSGGMPGSGGACTCTGGSGGTAGTGGRADAAPDTDLPKNDALAIDVTPLACTQTVDPELDQAIGQSTISASQKTQLCSCFAALTTTWTTSLTDLFATATPAEISRMLSGITSCCHSDGMTTMYGTNAAPSSTDLSRIKSGSGYMLCMAPAYKGVSFPD